MAGIDCCHSVFSIFVVQIVIHHIEEASLPDLSL